MEMIPEMMGLREASRKTNLSYDSLRKMCLNNEIPHIRVGKVFNINYTALCRRLNGEEVHFINEE